MTGEPTDRLIMFLFFLSILITFPSRPLHIRRSHPVPFASAAVPPISTTTTTTTTTTTGTAARAAKLFCAERS